MPNFETLSQALTEEIRRAQNGGAYPKVAFDDERVCRRQNLANGGFSAAGHTREHDIFLLGADLVAHAKGNAVIQLGVQKDLNGADGLRHQHQQTAFGGDAARPRV